MLGLNIFDRMQLMLTILPLMFFIIFGLICFDNKKVPVRFVDITLFHSAKVIS